MAFGVFYALEMTAPEHLNKSRVEQRASDERFVVNSWSRVDL